jgi:hypothetical protein
MSNRSVTNNDGKHWDWPTKQNSTTIYCCEAPMDQFLTETKTGGPMEPDSVQELAYNVQPKNWIICSNKNLLLWRLPNIEINACNTRSANCAIKLSHKEMLKIITEKYLKCIINTVLLTTPTIHDVVVCSKQSSSLHFTGYQMQIILHAFKAIWTK